MKNRLKYAISATTVAALTLPALVMAQWDAANSTAGGAGLSRWTVGQILTSILNWLMLILGIVGVLAFVVSGIMYVTAAGDETRIDTAKKIMTYAIIGLVVALIGWTLVQLVGGLVGTTGTAV